MRNEKGQFIKGHPIFPNNPLIKGNKIGPRFKKGYIPWNKDKKLGHQSKDLIAKRVAGYKGKPLSEEHKKKLSLIKKGRTGSLSNSWRGGLTLINKRIRNSQDYANWRKAVMKRDDYTCQICLKRGGYLEVDHIKSFAKYPELRFELSNGRTLCKECHTQTDTYSWKTRWGVKYA